MTPYQSRILNAFGLIAIDTVLLLAFVDQLYFSDLPCPLCILSRAAFIAAGFGLALNLLFGPRPGHYALTLLGACVGAIISVRQILLHIVPQTGSYGNAFFGFHLYTWALVLFALMVAGTAIMLLFEGQFAKEKPQTNYRTILPVVAFMVLGALAVGNVISTLSLCGMGFCPPNPGGYLIFNDNLSITLLGKTS